MPISIEPERERLRRRKSEKTIVVVSIEFLSKLETLVSTGVSK